MTLHYLHLYYLSRHLSSFLHIPLLHKLLSSTMSEEPDYSSLPLEERLVHKVWKVRLEAYEETRTQIESSRNENDVCFQNFNSHPELFKQIVTDLNVVAQESGLKLAFG